MIQSYKSVETAVVNSHIKWRENRILFFYQFNQEKLDFKQRFSEKYVEFNLLSSILSNRTVFWLNFGLGDINRLCKQAMLF